MLTAEHNTSIIHLAHPLIGAREDYDPLLKMIGDARFVLLGEASHGTHEFYKARAEITQRLISEKGFSAVVVEADWPDAYRVNCYVRGESEDREAIDSLAGFGRFPTWMWRNAEVLDFIGWLRDYNDASPATKCGFYGMDLYSLFTSIEAVLKYLDRTDTAAAKRARQRYGCFEDFGADTQAYGYAAAREMVESCEDAVVAQLLEMWRREPPERSRVAEDQFFYAEQNARLVKNAEEYYRCMFRGDVSSWNMRDSHMVGTLDALVEHLERQRDSADRVKVVVWAHNSHLGDARATEMSRRGEHNVGQLVRQKYGRSAVLVGFSTYEGTVTAAADWDKPADRRRVRPALSGSYEAMFHEAGAYGAPNFMLNLRDELDSGPLLERRLQRAIGVIYRPETERWSHYFHTVLPHQFDALLHYDHTRAVEPLELTARWERGEAPETYPSGI
jgi:erythromycin esterase-like protein